MMVLKMILHLFKRPQSKRRGRHGNYDQIGGTEHLIADFAKTGRAVQDNAVIVARKRLQQLTEPLGLVRFGQHPIEMSQRNVRCQQVEHRPLRRLDQCCGFDLTREDALCPGTRALLRTKE